MEPDPGFLPSEICRLVLGYLKEGNCQKTLKTFLQESEHLREYQLLLKQGRQPPTSIMGMTLTDILADYSRLKLQEHRGTLPAAPPQTPRAAVASTSTSQDVQIPRAEALQSARTGMSQRQYSRQLLQIRTGRPSRYNPQNMTAARTVPSLESRVNAQQPSTSFGNTPQPSTSSGNTLQPFILSGKIQQPSTSAASLSERFDGQADNLPLTESNESEAGDSSDEDGDVDDDIISVGSPERITPQPDPNPVGIIIVQPIPGTSSTLPSQNSQAGTNSRTVPSISRTPSGVAACAESVMRRLTFQTAGGGTSSVGSSVCDSLAPLTSAAVSRPVEQHRHPPQVVMSDGDESSSVVFSSSAKPGSSKRKKPVPRRRSDAGPGAKSEQQLKKIFLDNSKLVETLADNISRGFYSTSTCQSHVQPSSQSSSTPAAATDGPSCSRQGERGSVEEGVGGGEERSERPDIHSNDSSLEAMFSRVNADQGYQKFTDDVINNFISVTQDDPDLGVLFKRFGRGDAADTHAELHTPPPGSNQSDTDFASAPLSPPPMPVRMSTYGRTSADSHSLAVPRTYSSSLSFSTVLVDVNSMSGFPMTVVAASEEQGVVSESGLQGGSAVSAPVASRVQGDSSVNSTTTQHRTDSKQVVLDSKQVVDDSDGRAVGSEITSVSSEITAGGSEITTEVSEITAVAAVSGHKMADSEESTVDSENEVAESEDEVSESEHTVVVSSENIDESGHTAVDSQSREVESEQIEESEPRVVASEHIEVSEHAAEQSEHRVAETAEHSGVSISSERAHFPAEDNLNEEGTDSHAGVQPAVDIVATLPENSEETVMQEKTNIVDGSQRFAEQQSLVQERTDAHETSHSVVGQQQGLESRQEEQEVESSSLQTDVVSEEDHTADAMESEAISHCDVGQNQTFSDGQDKTLSLAPDHMQTSKGGHALDLSETAEVSHADSGEASHFSDKTNPKRDNRKNTEILDNLSDPLNGRKTALRSHTSKEMSNSSDKQTCDNGNASKTSDSDTGKQRSDSETLQRSRSSRLSTRRGTRSERLRRSKSSLVIDRDRSENVKDKLHPRRKPSCSESDRGLTSAHSESCEHSTNRVVEEQSSVAVCADNSVRVLLSSHVDLSLASEQEVIVKDVGVVPSSLASEHFVTAENAGSVPAVTSVPTSFSFHNSSTACVSSNEPGLSKADGLVSNTETTVSASTVTNTVLSVTNNSQDHSEMPEAASDSSSVNTVNQKTLKDDRKDLTKIGRTTKQKSSKVTKVGRFSKRRLSKVVVSPVEVSHSQTSKSQQKSSDDGKVAGVQKSNLNEMSADGSEKDTNKKKKKLASCSKNQPSVETSGAKLPSAEKSRKSDAAADSGDAGDDVPIMASLFLKLRQALLQTPGQTRHAPEKQSVSSRAHSSGSLRKDAGSGHRGAVPRKDTRSRIENSVFSASASASRARNVNRRVEENSACRENPESSPIEPGHEHSLAQVDANISDNGTPHQQSNSKSAAPSTPERSEVTRRNSKTHTKGPSVTTPAIHKTPRKNQMVTPTKDKQTPPNSSSSTPVRFYLATPSKSTNGSPPPKDKQTQPNSSQSTPVRSYPATPSKSTRGSPYPTTPSKSLRRTPRKSPRKSPGCKEYYDSLYSPRRARLLNEPIPEEVFEELSRHSDSEFSGAYSVAGTPRSYGNPRSAGTPSSRARLESIRSELESYSPLTSPNAVVDEPAFRPSPEEAVDVENRNPEVMRRLYSSTTPTQHQGQSPGCGDSVGAVQHTEPRPPSLMSFFSPHHDDHYNIPSIVSGKFVLEDASHQSYQSPSHRPGSVLPGQGSVHYTEDSSNHSALSTSSSLLRSFRVVGRVEREVGPQPTPAALHPEKQAGLVGNDLVSGDGDGHHHHGQTDVNTGAEVVSGDVNGDGAEMLTSLQGDQHASGSSGSVESVDVAAKEQARQRVFGVTSPGDLFISSGAGVGGEETCQQTCISNILPVNVQQFFAHQIETGELELPSDLTTDVTLLQHITSTSPLKSQTPSVSPAKAAHPTGHNSSSQSHQGSQPSHDKLRTPRKSSNPKRRSPAKQQSSSANLTQMSVQIGQLASLSTRQSASPKKSCLQKKQPAGKGKKKGKDVVEKEEEEREESATTEKASRPFASVSERRRNSSDSNSQPEAPAVSTRVLRSRKTAQQSSKQASKSAASEQSSKQGQKWAACDESQTAVENSQDGLRQQVDSHHSTSRATGTSQPQTGSQSVTTAPARSRKDRSPKKVVQQPVERQIVEDVMTIRRQPIAKKSLHLVYPDAPLPSKTTAGQSPVQPQPATKSPSQSKAADEQRPAVQSHTVASTPLSSKATPVVRLHPIALKNLKLLKPKAPLPSESIQRRSQPIPKKSLRLLEPHVLLPSDVRAYAQRSVRSESSGRVLAQPVGGKNIRMCHPELTDTDEEEADGGSEWEDIEECEVVGEDVEEQKDVEEGEIEEDKEADRMDQENAKEGSRNRESVDKVVVNTEKEKRNDTAEKNGHQILKKTREGEVGMERTVQGERTEENREGEKEVENDVEKDFAQVVCAEQGKDRENGAGLGPTSETQTVSVHAESCVNTSTEKTNSSADHNVEVGVSEIVDKHSAASPGLVNRRNSASTHSEEIDICDISDEDVDLSTPTLTQSEKFKAARRAKKTILSQSKSLFSQSSASSEKLKSKNKVGSESDRKKRESSKQKQNIKERVVDLTKQTPVSVVLAEDCNMETPKRKKRKGSNLTSKEKSGEVTEQPPAKKKRKGDNTQNDKQSSTLEKGGKERDKQDWSKKESEASPTTIKGNKEGEVSEVEVDKTLQKTSPNASKQKQVEKAASAEVGGEQSALDFEPAATSKKGRGSVTPTKKSSSGCATPSPNKKSPRRLQLSKKASPSPKKGLIASAVANAADLAYSYGGPPAAPHVGIHTYGPPRRIKPILISTSVSSKFAARHCGDQPELPSVSSALTQPSTPGLPIGTESTISQFSIGFSPTSTVLSDKSRSPAATVSRSPVGDKSRSPAQVSRSPAEMSRSSAATVSRSSVAEASRSSPIGNPSNDRGTNGTSERIEQSVEKPAPPNSNGESASQGFSFGADAGSGLLLSTQPGSGLTSSAQPSKSSSAISLSTPVAGSTLRRITPTRVASVTDLSRTSEAFLLSQHPVGVPSSNASGSSSTKPTPQSKTSGGITQPTTSDKAASLLPKTASSTTEPITREMSPPFSNKTLSSQSATCLPAPTPIPNTATPVSTRTTSSADNSNSCGNVTTPRRVSTTLVNLPQAKSTSKFVSIVSPACTSSTIKPPTVTCDTDASQDSSALQSLSVTVREGMATPLPRKLSPTPSAITSGFAVISAPRSTSAIRSKTRSGSAVVSPSEADVGVGSAPGSSASGSSGIPSTPKGVHKHKTISSSFIVSVTDTPNSATKLPSESSTSAQSKARNVERSDVFRSSSVPASPLQKRRTRNLSGFSVTEVPGTSFTLSANSSIDTAFVNPTTEHASRISSESTENQIPGLASGRSKRDSDFTTAASTSAEHNASIVEVSAPKPSEKGSSKKSKKKSKLTSADALKSLLAVCSATKTKDGTSNRTKVVTKDTVKEKQASANNTQEKQSSVDKNSEKRTSDRTEDASTVSEETRPAKGNRRTRRDTRPTSDSEDEAQKKGHRKTELDPKPTSEAKQNEKRKTDAATTSHLVVGECETSAPLATNEEQMEMTANTTNNEETQPEENAVTVMNVEPEQPAKKSKKKSSKSTSVDAMKSLLASFSGTGHKQTTKQSSASKKRDSTTPLLKKQTPLSERQSCQRQEKVSASKGADAENVGTKKGVNKKLPVESSSASNGASTENVASATKKRADKILPVAADVNQTFLKSSSASSGAGAEHLSATTKGANKILPTADDVNQTFVKSSSSLPQTETESQRKSEHHDEQSDDDTTTSEILTVRPKRRRCMMLVSDESEPEVTDNHSLRSLRPRQAKKTGSSQDQPTIRNSRTKLAKGSGDASGGKGKKTNVEEKTNEQEMERETTDTENDSKQSAKNNAERKSGNVARMNSSKKNLTTGQKTNEKPNTKNRKKNSKASCVKNIFEVLTQVDTEADCVSNNKKSKKRKKKSKVSPVRNIFEESTEVDTEAYHPANADSFETDEAVRTLIGLGATPVDHNSECDDVEMDEADISLSPHNTKLHCDTVHTVFANNPGRGSTSNTSRTFIHNEKSCGESTNDIDSVMREEQRSPDKYVSADEVDHITPSSRSKCISQNSLDISVASSEHGLLAETSAHSSKNGSALSDPVRGNRASSKPRAHHKELSSGQKDGVTHLHEPDQHPKTLTAQSQSRRKSAKQDQNISGSSEKESNSSRSQLTKLKKRSQNHSAHERDNQQGKESTPCKSGVSESSTPKSGVSESNPSKSKSGVSEISPPKSGVSETVPSNSDDDFELSSPFTPNTKSGSASKKRTGPVSRKNIYSESPTKNAGLVKPNRLALQKLRNPLFGSRTKTPETKKPDAEKEQEGSFKTPPNTSKRTTKKNTKRSIEKDLRDSVLSSSTRQNETISGTENRTPVTDSDAEHSGALLSMPFLGDVARSPIKASWASPDGPRSKQQGVGKSADDVVDAAPTLCVFGEGETDNADGSPAVVSGQSIINQFSSLLEQVESGGDLHWDHETSDGRPTLDKLIPGIVKRKLLCRSIPAYKTSDIAEHCTTPGPTHQACSQLSPRGNFQVVSRTSVLSSQISLVGNIQLVSRTPVLSSILQHPVAHQTDQSGVTRHTTHQSEVTPHLEHSPFQTQPAGLQTGVADDLDQQLSSATLNSSRVTTDPLPSTPPAVRAVSVQPTAIVSPLVSSYTPAQLKLHAELESMRPKRGFKSQKVTGRKKKKTDPAPVNVLNDNRALEDGRKFPRILPKALQNLSSTNVSTVSTEADETAFCTSTPVESNSAPTFTAALPSSQISSVGGSQPDLPSTSGNCEFIDADSVDMSAVNTVGKSPLDLAMDYCLPELVPSCQKGKSAAKGSRKQAGKAAAVSNAGLKSPEKDNGPTGQHHLTSYASCRKVADRHGKPTEKRPAKKSRKRKMDPDDGNGDNDATAVGKTSVASKTKGKEKTKTKKKAKLDASLNEKQALTNLMSSPAPLVIDSAAESSHFSTAKKRRSKKKSSSPRERRSKTKTSTSKTKTSTNLEDFQETTQNSPQFPTNVITIEAEIHAEPCRTNASSEGHGSGPEHNVISGSQPSSSQGDFVSRILKAQAPQAFVVSDNDASLSAHENLTKMMPIATCNLQDQSVVFYNNNSSNSTGLDYHTATSQSVYFTPGSVATCSPRRASLTSSFHTTSVTCVPHTTSVACDPHSTSVIRNLLSTSETCAPRSTLVTCDPKSTSVIRSLLSTSVTYDPQSTVTGHSTSVTCNPHSSSVTCHPSTTVTTYNTTGAPPTHDPQGSLPSVTDEGDTYVIPSTYPEVDNMNMSEYSSFGQAPFTWSQLSSVYDQPLDLSQSKQLAVGSPGTEAAAAALVSMATKGRITTNTTAMPLDPSVGEVKNKQKAKRGSKKVSKKIPDKKGKKKHK